MLGFILIGASVSAATIFSAALSGANEVPPTGSAATGSITVTLSGNSLSVSEMFSGLSSPSTAAHIHCCGAAGVNEPIALPFTTFPTAVTSGSFANTFDLTDPTVYSSTFLTAEGGTAAGAEAALIAALNAVQAYANIHSTSFLGGEIRGQLTSVPEPTVLFLSGSALAALALLTRRRRR
jgi:hypothetical protein